MNTSAMQSAKRIPCKIFKKSSFKFAFESETRKIRVFQLRGPVPVIRLGLELETRVFSSFRLERELKRRFFFKFYLKE